MARKIISPCIGYLSSGYGWRGATAVTSAMFHAGIDIANDEGTNVYAAWGGTVIETGWDIVPYRSGKGVKVRNPDGMVQYYGHLKTIRVSEGDHVDGGDRIGDMGSTGNVTGPHLHFEVWTSDDPSSHVDPETYFEYWDVTPGSRPAHYSSDNVNKGSTTDNSQWPNSRLLVDGDFGELTVKAYQLLLSPESVGDYDGLIDGVFGELSVMAEQRWLTGLGYYHGRIDGVRGEMTIGSLQSFLFDKNYYYNNGYSKTLMVDGEFGEQTVMGLQRYLNSQAQYYR